MSTPGPGRYGACATRRASRPSSKCRPETYPRLRTANRGIFPQSVGHGGKLRRVETETGPDRAAHRIGCGAVSKNSPFANHMTSTSGGGRSTCQHSAWSVQSLNGRLLASHDAAVPLSKGQRRLVVTDTCAGDGIQRVTLRLGVPSTQNQLTRPAKIPACEFSNGDQGQPGRHHSAYRRAPARSCYGLCPRSSPRTSLHQSPLSIEPVCFGARPSAAPVALSATSPKLAPRALARFARLRTRLQIIARSSGLARSKRKLIPAFSGDLRAPISIPISKLPQPTSLIALPT